MNNIAEVRLRRAVREMGMAEPSRPPAYFFSPISGHHGRKAEEILDLLLKDRGVYNFADDTPALADVRPSDWLCIHVKDSGIAWFCRVSGYPDVDESPLQTEWPIVFKVDSLTPVTPPLKLQEVWNELSSSDFGAKDPRSGIGLFLGASKRLPDRREFCLLTRQQHD